MFEVPDGKVNIIFPAGGHTFAVEQNVERACGIPDGDTIILTGGGDHSNVTRLGKNILVPSNSIRPMVLYRKS